MAFALQLFGRKRNWKLGRPNLVKGRVFLNCSKDIIMDSMLVSLQNSYVAALAASVVVCGGEASGGGYVCVRSWQWDPHDGFGALVGREGSLFSLPREDTVQAKKGTLIKNQVSDFSAFRTVKITVCCLSAPCMGFCQSSLS